MIPNTVKINGVEVSGAVLISFLDIVTNPKPDRWYRFERVGDVVKVDVKVESVTTVIA